MAETYWERKLWDPEMEAMPREELRKLQEKKLRRILIYAYENAPFYKELYDKEKVDVYKIRTIEDYQKYVPTVIKEDLRKYRERTGDLFCGILCLPLKPSSFNYGEMNPFIGRLFHSTGTTGDPTWQFYTKKDVEIWTESAARAIWRQGARPGDVLLAGWGGAGFNDWHPASAGLNMITRAIGLFYYLYDMLNPQPAFDLAMRLEAQGIHINAIYTFVPSYRWLIGKMESEGKNLKRDYFPELKLILNSGELSKSFLDYGCRLFGAPVVGHSAISETTWAYGDCVYDWKEGDEPRMYHHHPEDLYFVEIFPPGSDEAIEGAEFGEYCVTCMENEALAYVRFRAEDWERVRWEPCPHCGCTHIQTRTMSRVSESVTVKDKIITMGDVEDILYTHPESRPLPAQLIREEPQPQDKLRLRVSYNAELVKEPEQFRLKLADDFKKGLSVDTEITLITPEEVRAVAHKFERVIKEKRQS
jgi:phenylacetate-CoA ligase